MSPVSSKVTEHLWEWFYLCERYHCFGTKGQRSV